MTRLPAFAVLASLAAAPGIAAPQTQDCIAAGLVTIDAIDRGTQAVPRDPRAGGHDLLTISVGIRNISNGPVNFTAEFAAPYVQQSFVAGRSWTVQPGQRAYFSLANVLKPGPSDVMVRGQLRLTCR